MVWLHDIDFKTLFYLAILEDVSDEEEIEDMHSHDLSTGTIHSYVSVYYELIVMALQLIKTLI